jgi:MFS family permease
MRFAATSGVAPPGMAGYIAAARPPHACPMSEASAFGPFRSYKYVVLLASVLLFLVGMGAMFQLAVSLKPMADDFGWPRAVPSIAFSLQFLGSGLGGIVMGFWMDRAGAAKPVMLGALMMGTGAMLASRVGNEWELYLIYGVMLGLGGQATLYTPLMTNVMLWFADRRGMALGVVASGQSVAGVLWPPVFRYFNDSFGWRETFFWYGLFAFLTMTPLALVLRRRPEVAGLSGPATVPRPRRLEAPKPRPVQVLGRLNARQLQFCLQGAILGCCVAMSLPLGHIVAHTSDLGHPLARGAEMLSIILGASFFSRVFGGSMIVDRFGGLRALFVFSGLQAAGLGLFALVDGLLGLYLVSALFGLGYGGINMCYPSIIREYLPASEAGRRTGMVVLFGAFGMAIGGWVGGQMYDLTGGYTVAFLIGFAFNLANLAIVASLIHCSRSPRVASPLPA